jgi:hypothetical protein
LLSFFLAPALKRAQYQKEELEVSPFLSTAALQTINGYRVVISLVLLALGLKAVLYLKFLVQGIKLLQSRGFTICSCHFLLLFFYL